jgi:tRNA-specific 2-thiouridylase
MGKKLIAVALSGGVDSSTAAILLKKAGYELIALHMNLWCDSNPDGGSQNDQFKSAKIICKVEQSCDALGIPLHIVDFKNDFRTRVVDYFCQQYIQGQTPNPCIICNKYLKFGLLLEKAFSLGADCLATGHYARVKHFDGVYHLLKGIDMTKDQSYVLYTLGQEKLRYIYFPLGDYFKDEVRQIARQSGLPSAEEPASQDICFIDGEYGDFIRRRNITVSTGEITDSQGKLLGQHDGIPFYTVGQRRGLNISGGKRLFVIRIDPQRNRIVIGPEEELFSQKLVAKEVNWVSGNSPSESINITAKIRYKSPEVDAVLFPETKAAKLQFLQPQRAITPGQAVVFYRENEVIGGGIIEN